MEIMTFSYRSTGVAHYPCRAGSAALSLRHDSIGSPSLEEEGPLLGGASDQPWLWRPSTQPKPPIQMV